MWFKRLLLPILGCILLAAAGFAVTTYYTANYFSNPGPLTTLTTIVIPNGASTKSITRQLASKNIINQPFIFFWTLRLTKKDTQLKSGEYTFAPGTSPTEVTEKLLQGKVVEHQITLPEGWTTAQVLEALKSNDKLTGELPESIKEGSLLPETYTYRLGDSRAFIISQMQQAMGETLDALWQDRSEYTPVKTKEEAVILASIIEKETAVPEERSHIAGVFTNRLKSNMPFQTDPSVIYAITQGNYILERPLTKKDLKIDSPYNTYLHKGLPPGPIANPGKEAIFAALHPMATKDLYFVADGNGGHAFAQSLQEHIRNIHKWQKRKRLNQQKK